MENVIVGYVLLVFYVKDEDLGFNVNVSYLILVGFGMNIFSLNKILGINKLIMILLLINVY